MYQQFQPYDQVPQPQLSEKEKRIALWVTVGSGAAYAFSLLLSAGNSRRNSVAWKKEVRRRQESDKRYRR